MPEVGLHVLNRAEAVPEDARGALLNVGLRAATGRYVAFLDYDDVIYPEGYRVLIGELEASGAAVAFGGVLNTMVARGGLVPVTRTKRRVFEGTGLSQLLRSNFCPLHSFVVDRAAAGGLLEVDEGLAMLEDYDLLLRLCSSLPSSFRRKDKIVGEYLLKDDGSNVNPLAYGAAAGAAWEAASAVLERRKAGLVLSPVVQGLLGVDVPGLTVAEYLAGV